MPTKSILVVGGAGYIGSHMVAALKRANYFPVVLDNLSTGHQTAVKDAKLFVGSMSDQALLDELFATYSFEAVMHFASFIQVGESMTHPEKYYSNNVVATFHLLQAMLKWNVKKIIFSSTAAVYGEPVNIPIKEDHPLAPINPYGHSKRMVEQILEDFAKAYALQFISLRYFNAAGADVLNQLFECHQPETHLIPLVLQAAEGVSGPVHVFGRDYPTPDGTCIRDYIHVMDLCQAHLLALQALLDGKKNGFYNLGTGSGFSVQEVIQTVEKVTGLTVPIKEAPRRIGDPAILIADPSKAFAELNWQPKFSDLNTIVQNAAGIMLNPVIPTFAMT